MVFSRELGTAINSNLEKDVKRLLAGMEVSNGVCHTEFVISRDGPVLIEVNPRIGGMRIADALDFSCGRSLFSEMIRMHLGDEPQIPLATERGMMEYHMSHRIAAH